VKYLIVLLVVLAGLWAWRNGRRTDLPDKTGRKPTGKTPPAEPPDMVRCAVCGVHLPRAEALTGRAGSYCSQAHRQQAEG
jgi:uncharacterized protein